MGQDKDGLTKVADELRAKSTDVQIREMDHKVAEADDKFTHLQDAINDRYVFIIKTDIYFCVCRF